MSGADWITANQRVLVAEFARLGAQISGGDTSLAERNLASAREAMPSPAAIDKLGDCFNLTRFERDVLLLCAGAMMDTELARACEKQAGVLRDPQPSFNLALARLSEPHWSALTPIGPLRRFCLLEVRDHLALTSSGISIDERVLHFLAGINYLDTRLSPIVRAIGSPGLLGKSHQDAVSTLVSALDPSSAKACVQLAGDDNASHNEVARRVAQEFGLQLHELNSNDIPSNVHDLESLAALWRREAILLDSALLLRIQGAVSQHAIRLLNRISGLVFISLVEESAELASDISVSVRKLDAVERNGIWRASLGEVAGRLNGSLEELSAHFQLSTGDITRTASELCAQAHEPDSLESELWQACRQLTRRGLDELAQRIEPRACWQHLVLPDAQLATLREVASQVRHRFTVYERWGFAGRSARGLGISALFSGESGTGKTMAAEVLANELRLDLFRIDLASLVSKYIGETEKNLRRVFDAAEDSGAILLFDEADALFGKRGEVKDGNDRYANIEVSYLLQRMEAYRGLAILTTNLKRALDPAFYRRLRFVVQFPFPDAKLRECIWRGAFPQETPTSDISYTKLAQLNVAGGDIRNIAVNAAFLAAADQHPIAMQHLLSAVRREAAKRDRPFSDAEVRGWT